MKICVLGASGFVGKRLVAALRIRHDQVVIASLRDPKAAALAAADCDVVVNLAGEPIAQRWSSEVKAKLRSSRVDAPRAFLDALKQQANRPKRYISASAIGYYGTSKTATFDETSAAGQDFLSEVCVAWERVAESARDLGMSVGILRTGLVVGRDGGIIERILPIFKAAGGGPIGDGKQWYSWIHIDDTIGLYLMLIDGADGIFNATAPEPVTNKEFTAALGEAVHRPAILPVPKFALQMMLGEGMVVAVEGQRVLPTRTLASGYRFQYPDIASAFKSIAG